jgi:hypothetical protein
MHLGFSTLIQHFLPFQSKSSKQRPAPRRRRRLLAEPLESRFALSTLADGTMVEDPLPSSDPAIIYADPADAEAPPGDPQPSNPPPTDPPPADPSADPTRANAAPVINGFTCTFDGEWYVLSGWVSDDQNPEGTSVLFSGIIGGTTVVEADLHFTYTFQVPSDFHGEICAVAYDSLGLASNEATVTI